MMRKNERRQQHVQWCLGIVACSLHCCVIATTSVTQMMVHYDNGGGSADDGAFALLTIPCLLLQLH
jgi:hypothetical protein